MDKHKVFQAGSKGCANCRIDYLLIERSVSLHKNICALAAELDLEVDEFDVDYSESTGIKISDNKIYKMIIADESDQRVWLIIETQKEKEKLMKLVEKYFMFN